MPLVRPLLAFAAALLLGAGQAMALPVEVYFAWGSGPTQNTTYDSTELGEVANGDGTYSYGGSATPPSGGSGWNLSWDVTVKEDPFIDGILAVTNNTASTQTYIITFLLPISPAITPSSLAGASVVGTLTVNSGGGTLGHVLGQPMFTAELDGATYDTLLPDPSGLTLAFGSGSTAADSFGLPGLTQPGPAVATSMAIRLAFTLTAGDSASFTSRFEVVPVPEPMTALMLAGGLIGLALAGRQRA